MIRHEDMKILPYSPRQIYAMVADIKSYPEFLPWCQAARIRREWQEEGVDFVEADLIIAFMAFREKFGSQVAMDREELCIDVDYLDGPFRVLKNHWRFEACEEGCKVQFMVEFEFKSKILELAIGKIFDEAMRRIVEAFEKRAVELFG